MNRFGYSYLKPTSLLFIFMTSVRALPVGGAFYVGEKREKDMPCKKAKKGGKKKKPC